MVLTEERKRGMMEVGSNEGMRASVEPHALI